MIGKTLLTLHINLDMTTVLILNTIVKIYTSHYHWLLQIVDNSRSAGEKHNTHA